MASHCGLVKATVDPWKPIMTWEEKPHLLSPAEREVYHLRMCSCVALQAGIGMAQTRRKGNNCKIATTSHHIHFGCCGRPAQQRQLPSQGFLSPDTRKLSSWDVEMSLETPVFKKFHCLHGDFKTHSRFQSSRKVYQSQSGLQFLFKLSEHALKINGLKLVPWWLHWPPSPNVASLASSWTTCTACSQQLQTIARQWAGKCAANAISEPNTINSNKKRWCIILNMDT